MVVRVTDPAACWEAFQASLVLKRAHKRLNRTVIQALVRERLELRIDQLAALWHSPDMLDHGMHSVESWMKSELSHNGLELERLELTEIPRGPRPEGREGLAARYDEFWLEKIATADGFELTLSLVVRTWVPPILAGTGQITWPHESFKHHATQYFGQLDAETALAQISHWQSTLSPLLEQMGHGVRSAWALMSAPRHGLLREETAIGTDLTWVTRKQIRSGSEAFVPGQRYRYLDAYHLFFLLRNWQQMPERYRMGRG